MTDINSSITAFSLKASAVNDHVMGMILDYEYDRAYDFISEELVPGGFPKEFIYDLLTGKKMVIDTPDGLALSFNKNEEFIHEIEQLKREITTEYFQHEGKYYLFLDELNEADAQFKYSSKTTIHSSITDVIADDFSVKGKPAFVFHDRFELHYYIGMEADLSVYNTIMFYQIDVPDVENKAQLKKEQEEQKYVNSLRQKLSLAINERKTTLMTVSVHTNDQIENREKKEFTFPREIAIGYVMYTLQKKFNEAYDIWKPVSPTGVKMQGDSPFHTDFWLALDFPFTEEAIYGVGAENGTHSSLFYRIAMEVLFTIEKEERNKFVFLSGNMNGKFTGNVVFADNPKITDRDILVLPNANACHLEKALKAGCVVVETGGKMSHIVMVTKNDMLPIILIENAISKFKNTKTLTLNFTEKLFL